MARTTKKAVAKGRKAKPAKAKTARRPVASKASKATKAKPTTRSRKGAARPKAGKKAPQGHMAPARRAAIRRQVARPRVGEAHAKMDEAQHAHQDPRIEVPGIGAAGDKVQTFNYGQFKNKAVARMDKPQNWFRRGAKPPQK